MTTRTKQPPTISGHLLVWVLCGPLLILLGAGLGRWFPEAFGRAPEQVWRDSQPEPALTEVTGPPAPAPAFQPASLAPVVDRVRPGVVRVTTLPESPRRDGAPGRYLDPAEAVDGVVLGSGFVVHEAGLIVTAHHVIEGHRGILVDVPGHRQPFAAELVGEDHVSDLALLRLVDGPDDLRALEFGVTPPRQGDLVFSLGNPYAFHSSLSVGWVTFTGRHLPEEQMRVTNEYLQFSAPVNPGDSGAAVFDVQGAVVGMTRRTLRAGRGISFAVPGKVIKALLRAVQSGTGRIRRGYIGVEFRQPRRPEALRGLVREGGGAEVIKVARGDPADAAGIRIGDVILSFDGDPVDDAAELYDRIVETPPGRAAPLSIMRAGRVLGPISVTVGEVAKPTESTD